MIMSFDGQEKKMNRLKNQSIKSHFVQKKTGNQTTTTTAKVQQIKKKVKSVTGNG